MEIGQLTPFFSSTFSTLFVTYIHFLKIVKILFHVVSPLVDSGM